MAAVQGTSPLDAEVPQGDLPAGTAGKPVAEVVRDALLRRDAMLAFQPVMQARRPGNPAFYEALIRIRDRQGRILPARDFVAEVEGDRIGRDIDCLALELGLAELAADPGLRLAVNLSALSIGDSHWAATLERGLAADPTVAERLILEITERSAMSMPAMVRAFMTELQAKGICFALDDFGAGFTAFRYFKEFHFDILKIDGQFARDIDSDPDNQVLMAALTSIGRHFDMMTVAEAVETEAEARFLAAAGVDCLQGYFFGRPQPRPAWRRGDLLRSA